MAKKEKNLGIDRWTNNGYGLKVKPAITKEQARKIDKEAGKKNGKSGK